MRRAAAVVLLLALLVPAMTLNAFAASDGDGVGLWDILDGIGSFFDWVVDSIGNAVIALLDGLKALFIPQTDYFPRVQKRLQDKLGERFGGLLSSMKYLRERFAALKAYPGLNKEFTVKFPKGHLLGGVSVNLIKDVPAVIAMVRGAFSGFVVLLTAAFAYRKITAFINT